MTSSRSVGLIFTSLSGWWPPVRSVSEPPTAKNSARPRIKNSCRKPLIETGAAAHENRSIFGEADRVELRRIEGGRFHITQWTPFLTGCGRSGNRHPYGLYGMSRNLPIYLLD